MGKTMKGIDVSERQKKPQWYKVKEQIDFALVRAGEGAKHVDDSFQLNVNGCTKNEIPFGVYWEGCAVNSSEAEKEIDCFLDTIKEITCEYPVVYILSEDAKEKEKIATLFDEKTAGVISMIGIKGSDDLVTIGYADDHFLNGGAEDGAIVRYSTEGKIKGISGSVNLWESKVDFVREAQEEAVKGACDTIRGIASGIAEGLSNGPLESLESAGCEEEEITQAVSEMIGMESKEGYKVGVMYSVVPKNGLNVRKYPMMQAPIIEIKKCGDTIKCSAAERIEEETWINIGHGWCLARKNDKIYLQ